MIHSFEKTGTYEKDIKGITVVTKVKTYTKIKTLLSHLVAAVGCWSKCSECVGLVGKRVKQKEKNLLSGLK